MGEIRIQIGTTDGFRYIGIQPPITDQQQELLKLAEGEDKEMPSRFGLCTPHFGEPYSEIGKMTEGYGSRRSADMAVIETARKLANVLNKAGDIVKVDEKIKPIGFGHFLFGGQAERLG